MKSSRTLFLAFGLFLVWIMVTTILRINLGSTVRFFSDDYDRAFYFDRGSWLVNHQIPYQDTISEYPQIPTYLFGLTRIVTLGDNDLNSAYWKFSALFSIITLIVLFATIELLNKMLGPNHRYAYLLLLPAPLFFAINRFDVLPAYITLLSYKMIRDKRWLVASFLLGVGALTKWYPALLLPAYLIYYQRNTRQIPWKMLLVFSITCFVIILPTLLAGGVDALLVPYRFHTVRGMESASLPTLLITFLSFLQGAPVNSERLTLVFLLLQVAIVPCVIFVKIDNLDKLLNCCILIICGFIMFSRIYSPQWMLWIFPFCILTIRNRTDIGVLILYGVLTYIGFPVVWDYFGFDSAEMSIMGILNVIFVLAIMVSAANRLRDPRLSSQVRTETAME